MRAAGALACAAAALPVVLALPRTGAAGVVGLAAYVVCITAFLVASSAGRSKQAARTLVAVQAVAAVAAAHAVPTSAAPVLLVVIAAQLPTVCALRTSWFVLLVLTGLHAFALRDADTVQLIVTMLVFLAFEGFALYTTVMAERERKARAELAAALLDLRSTRALLAGRARQAERERLTADLHDVLGHDLVALRVHLEAARRLPDAVAATHLETASETAARMLDDVRELVRERYAKPPTDLAQALAPLGAGLPGLRVDLDVQDGLLVDDPDAAEAALRCAQEAITNAVRHAEASEVRVSVRREEPRRLVVEAVDDGRGAGSLQEGGGLRGMRERAARLGGSFNAGPAPGGGFALRLEIPLPGTGA